MGDMPSYTLSYEVVTELYANRSHEWKSAQASVENFLNQLCEEVLAGEDRSRLKVAPGRIKDVKRTLEKARRKLGNSGVVGDVDDIATAVKDIVGVKLVCKTLRDSNLVADAIQERCNDPESNLRFHNVDDNKDYVERPKASGYRARHFLFELDVPGRGKRPVIVELQVKTMLQDAWGELTHEDLYNFGALAPSEHHADLARTIAGLLWEVDLLADIIAKQADRKMEPTRDEIAPSEATNNSDRTAIVTHTGPRYALATDDEGKRGLIPAIVVRDLVGSRERIDVDDYIDIGARLTVQAVETDTGYYFHPLRRDELDQVGNRHSN